MTSNTPRTDPGTQTVCLAVPLLPGTTSTDRDHLRAVHGLDDRALRRRQPRLAHGIPDPYHTGRGVPSGQRFLAATRVVHANTVTRWLAMPARLLLGRTAPGAD